MSNQPNSFLVRWTSDSPLEDRRLLPCASGSNGLVLSVIWISGLFHSTLFLLSPSPSPSLSPFRPTSPRKPIGAVDLGSGDSGEGECECVETSSIMPKDGVAGRGTCSPIEAVLLPPMTGLEFTVLIEESGRRAPSSLVDSLDRLPVRGGGGSEYGSSNQNIDPLPYSLSTPNRPFDNLTICRTRAKPSPEPLPP